MNLLRKYIFAETESIFDFYGVAHRSEYFNAGGIAYLTIARVIDQSIERYLFTIFSRNPFFLYYYPEQSFILRSILCSSWQGWLLPDES